MDTVLQAAGGGMIAQPKPGDTVWVNLSGKWFKGQVKRLRPNLNGAGDTWAEVRGDTPERFVTTTKVKFLEFDDDRVAVVGDEK